MLYPSIPLIFMGEEYATDALFPFFADFEDPELRNAVDAGRANEYPQHAWDEAVLPSDPQAFLSAKCDRAIARDEDMLDWYRKLIKLRKQGLTEGWLCSSRLTVRHDSTLDLFSLHFAGDGGAEVAIHARLTSPDRQSTDYAAVAGDLLLSSEPVLRDEAGRILLRTNHTVIARCTGG